MKKIFLPLLLIIAIFSCKKNSTPQTSVDTNASLLVGKWIYTQDTVSVYTKGVLTDVVTDGGGIKFDGTFFEEFDQSGTGLTQGPTDYASKYTYKVDGNTITTTHQKQVIQGFTYPEIVKTYTIKFISSNKLILYNENYTAPNSPDKITEMSYFIKH